MDKKLTPEQEAKKEYLRARLKMTLDEILEYYDFEKMKSARISLEVEDFGEKVGERAVFFKD